MFKEKCFICKQKDKRKNMKFFQYPFSYGCYYHKSCLEDVVCNAKKYNSNILDLIVDIVDDIKQQKAQRITLLLQCNKICKELQGNGKAPTGNPHQTM